MERTTKLSSLFNLVGGISGLISISLIIWQGGQLYQRVEDHGKRLDRIEVAGSGGLREHVKGDDERVMDIRQRLVDQSTRLTHIEDVNTKLLELSGELKAVNAKLDALKEQIKSKS